MPPDRPVRASKNPPTLLVTERAPRSLASEAFRALRTNLQFAGTERPYHSMVVTSASAGEGKTTTVANFGVVAAQLGLRVCLVDSDLRRPSLHRLFGLDHVPGLTTALVGGRRLIEVAKVTRVPNLSLLTCGARPPNPAELIGSGRMRELLEEAREHFDLVICDSPPVVAVADGLSLAALCDAVLLVVGAGRIIADVAKRATDLIEGVQGRIVGVILNRVDFRRDRHACPYYRYAQSYDTSGNGSGRRTA